MDARQRVRRQMILDCASAILQQSRQPTPERERRIKGMLLELELTQDEVVEIAIELVAP